MYLYCICFTVAIYVLYLEQQTSVQYMHMAVYIYHFSEPLALGDITVPEHDTPAVSVC